MKKLSKKTLPATLLALFFALAGFSGCEKETNNKDVPDSFDRKLELIAMQGIDNQSSISDCISEKIEEIETGNSKDSAIVKVQIFEGIWEDNIMYLIRNNWNSCIFCELYSDNCEKITLEEYQYEDFCLLSRDWKLIYEFGNGIF